MHLLDADYALSYYLEHPSCLLLSIVHQCDYDLGAPVHVDALNCFEGLPVDTCCLRVQRGDMLEGDQGDLREVHTVCLGERLAPGQPEGVGGQVVHVGGEA